MRRIEIAHMIGSEHVGSAHIETETSDYLAGRGSDICLMYTYTYTCTTTIQPGKHTIPLVPIYLLTNNNQHINQHFVQLFFVVATGEANQQLLWAQLPKYSWIILQ